MGRSEEYNTVKTQILRTGPLPTPRTAYHLVNQDEQECTIGSARYTTGEAADFQDYGKNVNRQPSRTNNQAKNKKDYRGNKNQVVSIIVKRQDILSMAVSR